MESKKRHVIMVASEDGALKGGKVGGVGDVIRSLPLALARRGWKVTVIIPAYGFLHTENPSRKIASIAFPFRGKSLTGELWEAEPAGGEGKNGVTHLLFEHPEIRGAPIYFNDPPGTPFKRDATKYALFCSAIGQYLAALPPSFVLHLHDWHAATILMLQELDPEFADLRGLQTVFTVHNLSIQGTRPMRGPVSSVEEWFPKFFTNPGWISVWRDPRYIEPCYTPMAVGIRFADRVNTVSPTYAEEILKPSDHSRGLYRGEGLEEFLQNAAAGNRLAGILNGCDYPPEGGAAAGERVPFELLARTMEEEVSAWRRMKADPLFDILTWRLRQFAMRPPAVVLTSITRAVEQKVQLLFERGARPSAGTALDQILRLLEEYNGVYCFLGTGLEEYEERLYDACLENDRFLFLRGFSELVARSLYANGDLFLMPSLFEPCGISQMVAMRDGQPCVVHAVGGLKDTVEDMVNGFAFSGATMRERSDEFVRTMKRALALHAEDPGAWEGIRTAARTARFTWEESAGEYIRLLYERE